MKIYVKDDYVIGEVLIPKSTMPAEAPSGKLPADADCVVQKGKFPGNDATATDNAAKKHGDSATYTGKGHTSDSRDVNGR